MRLPSALRRLGSWPAATTIRYLLVIGVLVGAAGVAGRLLSWPVLTASLGPTAYVFAAHQGTEIARLRNALIGHTVAVGAGLAALAVFGLVHHPSVSATGAPSLTQVAASAVASGVTVLLLELVGLHYAPAAATALLVATGLAQPGPPLIGLVLGLAIVIALGSLLGLLLPVRAEAVHGPGADLGQRDQLVMPPGRIDGFAPIADYAALGDGRTVALVASDGRLDWWPVPTLDSPPICAAILEPDAGGHFSLTPDGPFEATRRYLDGTNVLETTYITPTGEARVTEALNTGSAGRLPWTELAHRIEGHGGEVSMRWELAPGDRFGRASPWVTTWDGTPVVSVGDQSVAVVVDRAGPATVQAHAVGGRWTSTPGDRALIAIVATDNEPLFVPPARAIDARLDRTIDSWRRWSDLLEDGGPWAADVRRSALALKTLLAEATGAIAAAATTSLPEGIGGAKNWDYRYAWVRDSSFALDALINLGLNEEVHGAVSWLLDAVRRNGPALHVFYSLGGQLVDGESELDIAGYRHSRPVRSGNSASGQTQLGTFGDLLDTVCRYQAEGHLLDPPTGELLADLADRCCDRWRNRDSGIWELQRREHYTISKIGCWVALDRAARLADRAQIPDRHADRWRREADEIRHWVDSYCWSETKQAYTFYAGTDDLDAAVLLAGRTGFQRGARLSSTIDAVSAELGRGPLLYRYTGMDAEEGAFVACTFWMVDALVHTGRLEEACRLMHEGVALTNDVGLLAEQIDPGTGEFLGNVPQGLSHLALINAAYALRRAAG